MYILQEKLIISWSQKLPVYQNMITCVKYTVDVIKSTTNTCQINCFQAPHWSFLNKCPCLVINNNGKHCLCQWNMVIMAFVIINPFTTCGGRRAIHSSPGSCQIASWVPVRTLPWRWDLWGCLPGRGPVAPVPAGHLVLQPGQSYTLAWAGASASPTFMTRV